jgi:transposase
MFLRPTTRRKDGKLHRYWSVVENRRVRGGRFVQKTLLYLGEISDSEHAVWCRMIDRLRGEDRLVQLSLFPQDRQPPPAVGAIGVHMDRLELSRPRQWGACWLALRLWEELALDDFWRDRLPASREGTSWLAVLKTLVAYRLIDPGSEWRLHRLWFDQNAMGDLLGEDFAIAQKDTLYRCLDKLAAHKEDLFSHLRRRWELLFGARYEVLLYDLTSTYFESNPPFGEQDKRKFGYSRDKRSDCVQVVVALVVTPQGFPVAYEVLAGNTSDKTTLADFLKKIEARYGKASRIWLMDRGIPTEETLAQMRASDPPAYYLVGTPKGRLSRYEAELAGRPWQQVRDHVDVKLLPRDGELYVLARSGDRVAKERAMRRRQLKALWKRLKSLAAMKLTRDQLLLKLGAARQSSPSAWRLVEVEVSGGPQATLRYHLNKMKLREARRREGRYLLRTNLEGRTPEEFWQFYMQLVRVEEAFRNLKGDLAIRPIYHQRESRIEAHIFVTFLAYCLHVTLAQRLHASAPGWTPRSALEQLKAMQLIDVKVPTADGRWLEMSRYTQPDKAQQLTLAMLKLELPSQPPPKIHAPPPPPKITARRLADQGVCGEDFCPG